MERSFEVCAAAAVGSMDAGADIRVREGEEVFGFSFLKSKDFAAFCAFFICASLAEGVLDGAVIVGGDAIEDSLRGGKIEGS